MRMDICGRDCRPHLSNLGGWSWGNGDCKPVTEGGKGLGSEGARGPAFLKVLLER